jgi:hypothetical protein
MDATAPLSTFSIDTVSPSLPFPVYFIHNAKMSRSVSVLLSILLLVAFETSAFPVSPTSYRQTSTSLASDLGKVEQIEFKIYSDGRVEETVRGVKGNNCHKVTEKINESLGKVVASEPTEELYENELVIDQTLTNTVGDSSTDGASWEGKSSW